MPAYDIINFEPPAPLARVILRNLDNGTTQSEVPMLLDSGADVTLLPQTAINALGVFVAKDKQYELTGFDGTPSFTSVVRLELVFCHRTFRGQFLLID